MTIPPDQKLRREFIQHLKVVTALKNRASLRQLVKYLRANTSRKNEEFLRLSKEYLREYHQLHDFEIKPSKRVVNTFICTRRPPC